MLIVTYSSNGFSEGNRLNIENMLKSDPEKPEESTTTILLRYQNNGTKIDHNEASSASGFTSLSEESDITVSNISIELNEEFFSENYFSVTLGARYGINTGSVDSTNETTNLSYKDKVSGKSYGAGLSINLNTEGYGLKIQPFISSYYMINKNDYKLSYNNSTTNEDPFNISYTTDTNILQHSLGVRFINNNNNLMSYFSLDYLQEMSSSGSVEGKRSGSDLQLTNTSTVNQNDFAFSIGLGFLF